MTTGPLPDEASPTGSEPDLQLRGMVQDLLDRTDLNDPRFTEELGSLEIRHGTAVHAELLFVLSHLRFEPAVARRHWDAVLAHRETMSVRLGTPVDPRVALVSYFLEINRELRNPKVIELKLYQQTEASAYRDELTGLCNYRYFREHLAREIHRSERYGLPLSVLMIDIDDFKPYNDANGHETGNEALEQIARILVESLRRHDIPARYGGEEFVAILPATNKPSALRIADRTRRRIESHPFPSPSGRPAGRLTVSMGIASYPADSGDASDLIRRADSALYVSKTLGKNQVHLYSQSRRSFRRVRASLSGRFFMMEENPHPITTLDLSSAGVLFRADRAPGTGTLVTLNIEIPGAPRGVTVIGRVIRTEPRPRGAWETALNIVHISQEDRLHLVEFLERTAAAPGRPAVPGEAPGTGGAD